MFIMSSAVRNVLFHLSVVLIFYQQLVHCQCPVKSEVENSIVGSDAANSSDENVINTTKNCTADFLNHFALCKKDSAQFDKCIITALNDVRPFYTTGVPDLNIPPFDPWMVDELVERWGGPSMGFTLKLKNIKELGWQKSSVTKFRSNLRMRMIQYTQTFPEKYLEGEYETESNFLSPRENKGVFNLTLYDYSQTTTITRSKNSKDLRVTILMKDCGNLKLHISNLLRGRSFLEGILDRMINISWRPGLVFVRPTVNDLVSTAFNRLYNKIFADFNFDLLFPN